MDPFCFFFVNFFSSSVRYVTSAAIRNRGPRMSSDIPKPGPGSGLDFIFEEIVSHCLEAVCQLILGYWAATYRSIESSVQSPCFHAGSRRHKNRVPPNRLAPGYRLPWLIWPFRNIWSLLFGLPNGFTGDKYPSRTLKGWSKLGDIHAKPKRDDLAR